MRSIQERFQELATQNEKAFIAYVPFGYPDVPKTIAIVRTLADAGVDIIELGVPFSDPIADGPIIQEACAVALGNGLTTPAIFDALERLKKTLHIPLALMTYYNPVFTFGIKRFFSAMRTAGASGLLTVDLPIDEGSDYIALARKHELETIFFITPVTTDDRARAIIKHARGFIYYISVTGITGFRTFAYRSLEKHITHIKTMTQLPVCVGFGVHTSAQVKELGQFSDGVIVGSAIVAFIKHNHRKKDFLKLLYAYVRSLQRL